MMMQMMIPEEGQYDDDEQSLVDSGTLHLNTAEVCVGSVARMG